MVAGVEPKPCPANTPFQVATHRNGKRANEDAAIVGAVTNRARVRLRLAAIADGVSTQAGGDVAARRAAEEYIAFLRGSTCTTSAELSRETRPFVLRLDRAIRALGDELRSSPATTLSAICLFPDGSNVVLHVGDSRLYRVSRGGAQALTCDHTEKALARLRGLAEDDVACLDDHVLERCLGIRGAGEADILENAGAGAATGVFVLTTDGVHDTLSEDDLAFFWRQCGGDLAAFCSAAVAAAGASPLANGEANRDNITIAVLNPRAAVSADGLWRSWSPPAAGRAPWSRLRHAAVAGAVFSAASLVTIAGVIAALHFAGLLPSSGTPTGTRRTATRPLPPQPSTPVVGPSAGMPVPLPGGSGGESAERGGTEAGPAGGSVQRGPPSGQAGAASATGANDSAEGTMPPLASTSPKSSSGTAPGNPPPEGPTQGAAVTPVPAPRGNVVLRLQVGKNAGGGRLKCRSSASPDGWVCLVTRLPSAGEVQCELPASEPGPWRIRVAKTDKSGRISNGEEKEVSRERAANGGPVTITGPDWPKIVTVGEGDNLSKIVRQNYTGIKEEEVKSYTDHVSANNPDLIQGNPNLLQPKWEIELPDPVFRAGSR